MRAASVCLAILFAVAPIGAQAGNGNGNGNAYGHEKAADGGAGNGNAGGNSGGRNGQEKPTDTTVFSPEGLATVGADQNMALDAVQSGQALPLDRIEPIAAQEWAGRVIDAHLMRIHGTLIYRLTIVTDAGVSRRVYYDARTGASVPVR